MTHKHTYGMLKNITGLFYRCISCGQFPKKKTPKRKGVEKQSLDTVQSAYKETGLGL